MEQYASRQFSPRQSRQVTNDTQLAQTITQNLQSELPTLSGETLVKTIVYKTQKTPRLRPLIWTQLMTGFTLSVDQRIHLTQQIFQETRSTHNQMVAAGQLVIKSVADCGTEQEKSAVLEMMNGLEQRTFVTFNQIVSSLLSSSSSGPNTGHSETIKLVLRLNRYSPNSKSTPSQPQNVTLSSHQNDITAPQKKPPKSRSFVFPPPHTLSKTALSLVNRAIRYFGADFVGCFGASATMLRYQVNMVAIFENHIQYKQKVLSSPNLNKLISRSSEWNTLQQQDTPIDRNTLEKEKKTLKNEEEQVRAQMNVLLKKIQFEISNTIFRWSKFPHHNDFHAGFTGWMNRANKFAAWVGRHLGQNAEVEFRDGLNSQLLKAAQRLQKFGTQVDPKYLLQIKEFLNKTEAGKHIVRNLKDVVINFNK